MPIPARLLVRPGTKWGRLAIFLGVALVLILALRGAVVLLIDNGRLPAEKLNGVDVQGRYYPVERVCLVIDDSELEEGLEGSRLDRGTFSLLASGNGFVAEDADKAVSIRCGWRNWDYDKDPQVFFQLSASVREARIVEPLICRSTEPERAAETVTVGGFSACREDDGFEIEIRIVDDNALFVCTVKSQDETLLPKLEKALRSECEGFIATLARSRPISYLGSGFLTVR